MFGRSLVVTLAVLLETCLAGAAAAQIICPDSCRVAVTFTKTYTGNWNKGLPYDYITIEPNAGGETYGGTGITIDVTLKNCLGQPLVGVPYQSIVVYNANLCICPGGNIADAATDTNGHTSFSGLNTIRGGGCGVGLTVYVDGVQINPVALGVKINSTDTGLASPCFTDAADFAAFATRFGDPAQYSICFDYDESGPPTIDAGDLAFFADLLGAFCQ